ncbi:RNA-dependent RNA polymerase [Eriocheir sinensis reovirus]|uniref:RNA-directed RNA polymerase n=1 Tax=Eriocheir sinensis reovirus (isolate China/905) TaxID=648171 RepID=RDRP_ESRV9|nr:RNA-dependent RNA polymerase [Eriocheir sinensis reovirus]Q698V5.1 RecName: Full=RNA-directed RNA polymerase [Eriocheir sinensis reovirus isolate 905]AAT11887.1 RNA-dependent RNA polymerase [Eriocheir sinensis reovirus]
MDTYGSIKRDLKYMYDVEEVFRNTIPKTYFGIDDVEDLHVDEAGISNIHNNITLGTKKCYHLYKKGHRTQVPIYLGSLVTRESNEYEDVSYSYDNLNTIYKDAPVWEPLLNKVSKWYDEGWSVPSSKPIPYDPNYSKCLILSPDKYKKYHKVVVDVDYDAFHWSIDVNSEFMDMPNVIRAWDISTIPQFVDGFPMLKHLIDRSKKEALFYFNYRLIPYVVHNIDKDDDMWREWLSYFLHGDHFKPDRGSYDNFGSLLGHKRLEVALMYHNRIRLMPMSATALDAMNEGAKFLMKDPTYHTAVMKKYNGVLTQYGMAEPLGYNRGWGYTGVTTADSPFILSNVNGADGYTVIDREAVEEAKEIGMQYTPKLVKLQLANMTKTSSPVNLIDSLIGNAIISLTGFAGSEKVSTALDQFEKENFERKVPDELFTAISNVTYEMVRESFQPLERSMLDKRTRLLRLYNAGTSASSSAPPGARYIFNKKMIMYSTFLSKSIDVTDEYAPMSFITSLNFNNKTANILTHPQNYYMYDWHDNHNRIINSGSREVRGGRATRIITPDPPSNYMLLILGALNTVRDMGSHRTGFSNLGMNEVVGSSFLDAVSHDALAPQCLATSSSRSLCAQALDYSTWDRQQGGRIAEAKAHGIMRVANELFPNTNTNLSDVHNLLELPMSSILYLWSESIKSSYKYKIDHSTVAVDAVRSGELTTQFSNHVTNLAALRQYHETYNRTKVPQGFRPIEVAQINIVGDDVNVILRTADRKPFTLRDMEGYHNHTFEKAAEYEFSISKKRSMMSNVATEHIKQYFKMGDILLDVMLSSMTSERNTFREQGYMNGINLLYDIAVTIMARYAQNDKLFEDMMANLPFMEGVVYRHGSQKYHFHPSPCHLLGSGSPEILPSAIDLRTFARVITVLGDYESDLYEAMSSLNATLLSTSGTTQFESQVRKHLSEELGDNIISPVWSEVFYRDEVGYEMVTKHNKLTPEGHREYLVDRIISTLSNREKLIMNNADIIEKLLSGKLKKVKRYFQEIKFKMSNMPITGLPDRKIEGVSELSSPYRAADVGMRRVHKCIGLSRRNLKFPSVTERLSRLLKSYGLVTQADSAKILSAAAGLGRSSTRYRNLGTDLGLSDMHASSFAQRLPALLTQYEIENASGSFTFYDTVSRTYDVSEASMNERVGDVSNNPIARANSSTSTYYRFRGMLHCLYGARFGLSLHASVE